MVMSDFLQLFIDVAKAGVPFALVWRIGIYIVNTLIEWVTGGSNEL